MKTNGEEPNRKAIKVSLVATLFIAFIYLSFSFVKVSFDITTWSEPSRAFCAIFSIVVIAFSIAIISDSSI